MAQKIASAKGTFDILPNDMTLREKIKNTILEVYKVNGFEQIETPCIENLDILTKSEGGENLNLLFKILKRGEKLESELAKDSIEENDICDLGLRYDLTLPLSRFYASNRNELPSIFKSIQLGWVWRAEKPQKNRFRQFTQCDIDIIGEESEIAEIELITVTTKVLTSLGFENFTVKISDRRILKSLYLNVGFNEDDFNTFCVILDKLDKIGEQRVILELTEKGFNESSLSKFFEVIRNINNGNLEKLLEFNVDENILKSMKNVISVVEGYSGDEYSIRFDISLVRGMGYYTGQIFEIVTDEANVSIAGGGRYDRMIGTFLKEDVTAVGFSIGFERIFNILKSKNTTAKDKQKVALIVDINDTDKIKEALFYSNELKDKGYIVSILKKQNNIGKQLKRLAKEGFDKYCIYDRSNELNNLS